MSDVKKLHSAIAAALAVPLVLSGCASPTDMKDAVAEAILAADPAIVDVYMTSAAGPGGTSLGARVYVDSIETADLARVLDASLRAVLVGAPERPSSYSVDIAEAPKPSKVVLSRGAVSLEAAAREAGWYENFLNDSISASTDTFEARFGTWEELHK